MIRIWRIDTRFLHVPYAREGLWKFVDGTEHQVTVAAARLEAKYPRSGASVSSPGRSQGQFRWSCSNRDKTMLGSKDESRAKVNGLNTTTSTYYGRSVPHED